jgi:competence protein ComEA
MLMDASAPWRAIENGPPEGPESEHQRSAAQNALLAVAAVLVAGSVGAALFVAGQQGGTVEVVAGTETAGAAASPEMLVVEVAGAVVHPGVYELPIGSRVADAIQVAGGYSADVDPRAAEAQLNLAAKLQDAQLIRVPRRGDPEASGGTGGLATPGLLNLNTATAEQLDSLPGVGPVTAQKIIAARQEKPFASVDELVTRKIVTASTLAKFRSLVTVG